MVKEGLAYSLQRQIECAANPHGTAARTAHLRPDDGEHCLDKESSDRRAITAAIHSGSASAGRDHEQRGGN